MVAFTDIQVETPSRETMAARADTILALLRGADEGSRDAGYAAWEQARQDFESWRSLAQLKFQQDTRDPDARAGRELADALGPVAAEHETAIKRALLGLDRDWLIGRAGPHAVRLWQLDVTTFDPAIAADLEAEAKLGAQYTEIVAGARIEVEGQTVNLSGLAPFLENSDRDIRHRAARAQWAFFAEHGERLDTLYGELVALRDRMGRALGFADFTPLGYARMRRTDYAPADVARFRDEVVAHVVPVVARFYERMRARFGWERVMAWDEPLRDPKGNPVPAGGHDFLLDRAQTLFDGLHPDLSSFFRMMRDGGFLDLQTREGKAYGGFCTSFPRWGVPFIFANFNGTFGDVAVLTHEMGHAFQCWQSRALQPSDTVWPTADAAEIHSMSLEMLSLPRIGLLVGEDAAARTERMQLIDELRMLPLLCLGDHFQHEVYANPALTPAERRALWRRLETRYLPWRDYGDLDHPAGGGWWHRQLHYFEIPFYWIDYGLASACALQFWRRARADAAGALADYVALCARGGSAPFLALLPDAGLRSPFTPGLLGELAAEAEAVIGAD